jgi:branched-chain amino acid transport system substrate-binding protein
MDKKRVWIVGVIIIAIVVAIFVSFSAESSDTIKVGVTASLTGFGAPWGEDIVNGVDLAVKEINDVGGIGGKNLVVLYEDFGEYDLKMAATAAQKFISVDNADLIFTQWVEDTSVVSPITNEENKIVINIGSGADSLPKESELMFMIAPQNSLLARKVAIHAFENGVKNPVILLEQIPYFQNFYDETNKVWNEKTLSEIDKIEVLAGQKDYMTEITKIKVGGYDAMFVYVSPNGVPQVLKNAREQGLDIQVFGYVGIDDPAVVEASGELAEGIIYPDFPKSDLDFIEKYVKEYDAEPVFIADLAYDAIKVLEIAIKRKGTSTEDLIEGLHSVQDYSGASGIISINGDGSRIGSVPVLKKITNGVGVEIIS